MRFLARLDRSLELAEIAALLPTLVAAEAVEIGSSYRELLLEVPQASRLARERDLGDALARLKVPWRSEARAGEAAPLYGQSEAVLTVIAPEASLFPPKLVPQLAAWGLDISGLRRLSPADSTQLAVEIYLDDWSLCAAHREDIPALAAHWQVDLALTPADVKRPRRRIVAFDMDSTLIRCEVIDELAARAGVGREVAAVTERAMRGELDFRSSFRERMARLAGLPVSTLEEVAADLPLMDGAVDLLQTLRAQGHHTMILSGGFDYFAHRLRQRLGVDEIHANHLQIRDGVLTGNVDGAIVDGERKVQFLRAASHARGIALTDTVAVGDGANDLPMLNEAGLGVAFHAKPLVREQAPSAMSFCDLTGLLYLLGVPRGAEQTT